jgi:hypothetical protein
VIDGGEAAVRPPDPQSTLFQFGESLRRGHLVQKVEVDVKDGRCAIAAGRGLLSHDVTLPDLFE